MLDTDSSRYLSVDENTLSSGSDSVSSVLGILAGLQKVAEKYVITGEMRGDLMDVTTSTTAAIRQISDFQADSANEYADPRDYYDIINNCNYFIGRTKDSLNVLKKENALVHAIRAWTYMQVANIWGKAYYFTDPILSVKDAQKEKYPQYSVSELANALIADLEPFADAAYPDYGTVYDFASVRLFIPAKVVLGDLYLWRGNSTQDYEKAATYYSEYIYQKMTNYGGVALQPAIYWSYANFLNDNFEDGYYGDSWTSYTGAHEDNTKELISAIQMATTSTQGLVSQFPISSYLLQFGASGVATSLWDEQNYKYYAVATGATTPYSYTRAGDLRKSGNIRPTTYLMASGETGSADLLYKLELATHISIYRLGLIYLRYAEAVNRAGKPHTAFAVLKYGLNETVLADPTKIPASELADAKPYVEIFKSPIFANSTTINSDYPKGGIHARGCGDSAYDTQYVIGKGSVVAASDTIQWVEDAICDELALETSFEGNRFPDLIRLALRRGDNSFLARKVAQKHGSDYATYYNLLLNQNNWYLPPSK
jgi:hypothetical protein